MKKHWILIFQTFLKILFRPCWFVLKKNFNPVFGIACPQNGHTRARLKSCFYLFHMFETYYVEDFSDTLNSFFNEQNGKKILKLFNFFFWKTLDEILTSSFIDTRWSKYFTIMPSLLYMICSLFHALQHSVCVYFNFQTRHSKG